MWILVTLRGFIKRVFLIEPAIKHNDRTFAIHIHRGWSSRSKRICNRHYLIHNHKLDWYGVPSQVVRLKSRFNSPAQHPVRGSRLVRGSLSGVYWKCLRHDSWLFSNLCSTALGDLGNCVAARDTGYLAPTRWQKSPIQEQQDDQGKGNESMGTSWPYRFGKLQYKNREGFPVKRNTFLIHLSFDLKIIYEVVTLGQNTSVSYSPVREILQLVQLGFVNINLAKAIFGLAVAVDVVMGRWCHITLDIHYFPFPHPERG